MAVDRLDVLARHGKTPAEVAEAFRISAKDCERNAMPAAAASLEDAAAFVEETWGAVDEAAERIFQSGILDDIAGSNGGEGRDAMQDAVKIARLALGGQ